MKILHTLCTALAVVSMAVNLSSCDEHIEFPDTAMKTCDILCTDGEIVRFDDMVSKGKTPIGVVFHVNQDGKTEGTGYAVYLWDIDNAVFCDSIGVKQSTSANPTAFDGNSNTYAMFASGVSPAAPQSLTCGSMVRVPISLLSLSSSCFMQLVIRSTVTSADVVVTSSPTILTNVGIGVLQRSVDKSQPRHGSSPWLQVHFRKHLNTSRIRYDQS